MIPQLFMVLVALLPQVADTENNLVGGPVADAISKRLDTFSDRIEAWQKGSTLALERMDQAQAGRFAELVESMRSASEERKGIVDSIRELRAEREGIVAGIREFNSQREGIISHIASLRESASAARDEARAAREESRAARREAMEQWTPLQNLVKKLRGFVWGLIGLVCLLGVLVLVTLALVGWVYAKVKSKLISFG